MAKTRDRANLRVVVHRIIAVGDYVWAHVNFINLFNDDPQDRGIAGVDIYRMNSDGKAIEHWDVLQKSRRSKESGSRERHVLNKVFATYRFQYSTRYFKRDIATDLMRQIR